MIIINMTDYAYAIRLGKSKRCLFMFTSRQKSDRTQKPIELIDWKLNVMNAELLLSVASIHANNKAYRG